MPDGRCMDDDLHGQQTPAPRTSTPAPRTPRTSTPSNGGMSSSGY